MAVQQPLLDFVAERWRQHQGKAKAPTNAMRFINQMTQHGWRPVTFVLSEEAVAAPATAGTAGAGLAGAGGASSAEQSFLPAEVPGHSPELPGAPRAVASLIARCCADAAADRPSFAQALAELGGPVAHEVRRGDLDTGLPFGRNSGLPPVTEAAPKLLPTRSTSRSTGAGGRGAGGHAVGLPNTDRTRSARAPTSPRSIGFCAIWGCISSSSSSAAGLLAGRRTELVPRRAPRQPLLRRAHRARGGVGLVRLWF
jgi:hypothetical protein